MKFLKSLFAVLLVLISLTACAPAESKKIEKLVVIFVPSKDADTILAAVEPLKQLIIDQMKTLGYTINSVEITVSADYNAAGEALTAGTAHLAFIPANTYIAFHEDGAELLLAATRDGLNKDSENAKDWNDGNPTLPTTEQVTYYRSIGLVGPSAKGQELLAKVNAGTALTWEDVNSAIWCHSSTTSASGYIYPSVWLKENFDKTISDLTNHYPSVGGYSGAAADLASGVCDIAPGYADFRRDNEAKWVLPVADGGFGHTSSIWAETGVLFVTPGVMNDTISYSANNKELTTKVIAALRTSFIELAKTDAGKTAIAIYSHKGYTADITDADYDAARAAAAVVAGN
ncbi:MAG: PhnD/SsuA/transferrin family substrate-binding protein [Erysipelotrichaceae bacterium]|nr:PhnD/SsuA/transferrin family substrate-binding protein [Erysipelotrichaceae bacterium]